MSLRPPSPSESGSTGDNFGDSSRALDRILAGDGTLHDVEVMVARLDTVADSNRCYLPVQEQLVIRSIIRVFADELDAHLSRRALPYEAEVLVPKLLDVRGGHAIYDQRQSRKQPDWTYADA